MAVHSELNVHLSLNAFCDLLNGGGMEQLVVNAKPDLSSFRVCLRDTGRCVEISSKVISSFIDQFGDSDLYERAKDEIIQRFAKLRKPQSL